MRLGLGFVSVLGVGVDNTLWKLNVRTSRHPAGQARAVACPWMIPSLPCNRSCISRLYLASASVCAHWITADNHTVHGPWSDYFRFSPA